MLQREDLEPAGNPFDLNANFLPQLPDLSTLDRQLEESLRLFGPEDTAEAEDPNLPVTVLDDEDEPVDDTCPWNQCCPDWAGPVAKVIDWKETEAAYKRRIAQQTVDDRRVNGVMGILRARGEYRKLQPIGPAWRTTLDALETKFPNFAEVVDYLRVMYALAEQGDGVPQLTPILLNGEPGSGKSYFAEDFARGFGSTYLTTHMETAQSNAGLAGSAEYWSNSKPGDVFNLIVQGDFANPVICIDEIEKALSCDYDPLSSLYGLLEPGTAKAFRDLSYPWLPELDASRIIWLATANDADLLPAPILDRVRRFDIEPPSGDQARRLVRQIFRDVVAELPPAVASVRLTPDAVEVLTAQSPRRVKQLLREALGRAVYNRRKRVLARDILVDTSETMEGSRPMGFI